MFDSLGKLIVAYGDVERDGAVSRNWSTKLASGDTGLQENALLDAYISGFTSSVIGADSGVLYKSASDMGAIISKALLDKLTDNYKV